jgi:hypothetical protein
MFAELTGPGSTKNVVLATTMWDILSPKSSVGEKREQRLKYDYWNVMIYHGATVERFLNDPISAWNIIDRFLTNSHKNQLTFQEERVDQRKDVKQTSAGEALVMDLDQLVKRQHETMRQPIGQSNVSVGAIRKSQ